MFKKIYQTMGATCAIVLLSSSASAAEVGKQVSCIVRDLNGNEVYEQTIETGEDGDFVFGFDMPETAKDGVYSVSLYGDGVETPITRSFMYKKPRVIPTVRYADINGSINVSLTKITLSANVEVYDNSQLEIRLKDNSNNTYIGNTIITSQDGECNLNYEIGGIHTNKTYSLEVISKDIASGEEKFIVNGTLSTSALKISANAEISFNDNILINGTATSSIIEKSFAINENRGFEYTLPNLFVGEIQFSAELLK